MARRRRSAPKSLPRPTPCGASSRPTPSRSRPFPGTLKPEEGVLVSLSIIQGGLAPIPGEFAAGFNTESDRPRIVAHFSLHNVPGVEVEGVLQEFTSTLSISYADGTVDLRVEGNTVSGEFELAGRAFTTGDSVYVASVEGRFEAPFEPYQPRR